MTSQQIKTLLAPPSVKNANQRAVLFVNSRFQTLDDLDELESLVLETQQRNNELQSQLSLSQFNIDALLTDMRVAAEAHLHSAQELSLLRHSLTDELSELSQELISTMSDGEAKSTLLQDIEAFHRNLKELQSVKGYLQVIEHALKLSEGSAKQIHDSTTVSISASSLSEYQALQTFVANVSKACFEAEDGSKQRTLHLIQFLETIRAKTWSDIQRTLSSSLQTAAEKIGWPMPIDYSSASAEDRGAFERAFRNLLKLQKWGERFCSSSSSKRSTSDGLYPLVALVHPISLRFKYHFEGNRQTNRLDKPEWYFTHVLNVAHEHRNFMESVIQRLLADSEYKHINSWREFTLLLLPLLSKKLTHTIPSLLSHPPLLAHTIYQALAFDAALAEEGFVIQETSAAEQCTEGAKWEGVSEVILGNTEWFEAWLHGEQKFAESQYYESISSVDAWIIASDDGDSDSQAKDTLTTNSARRICALIEQVTDRYSPLPQFIHRTRFLVSIQLPILDYYHGRIVSSLDAFETFSSAFVRAVPGALSVTLGGNQEGGVHVDSRGLTSGVEGVQRLCKALLSAKYVEASMRSWGEDLFFIELWTEISQNPTLRSQAAKNPLLPKPKAEEGEVLINTLFEELISRYEHLVDRAEAMILQQVCGEIESILKSHFTAATSPNPKDKESDGISVSRTLLAPVALLSSHLTFLRTTLPQTTLTALYRRISSRLAEHILQRQILYRGHFDLQEGRRIRAESQLWVETCHAALGGGLNGGRARVEAPWVKLLQASSLASADGETWTTLVDVTFGTQTDEDWETSLASIVGFVELSREEARRTLRRREDCNH